MREWLTRLRDWLRRDRLDQELGEELRFHRARLEHDAREAGADPAEAGYAAHRRLGNVTHIHEAARERWSWPRLDNLLQDLRYALRGLRHSPGFTATVVLTLGLGIGANAAMFGVIDRLMFRPFPYLRDPARVHRVYLQTTIRGRVFTNFTIPYTRYRDLKRTTSSFSQYAGFAERTLAVGSGDAGREQRVAAVSASFFDFFDARPVLGRFFSEAEDSIPRGAAVVVLGYGFWKAEFGASNVIGRTLPIGTIDYTIIGVAPKDFAGVAENPVPAVFIPITTVAANEGRWDNNTYFTRYNWDFTSVMVRRKDGITEAAADADLSNAYMRSRDAQRLINPAVAPTTVARPRGIAGPLKPAAGPDAGLEAKTLLWVTGVAVIVLLIACANVTNLMLARILRRRREIAMRLALGVSRRRLVIQLLTESLLLAPLGCVAGLGIAQWGGAGLRLLVIPGEAADFATDWRTLAVACGFALAAGLITSVGPALLAIRGDLAATLRAGAREGTYQRSRLRSALLIVQGALSVILLVGAGLFVRSLDRARAMHLGYDAEPVLMVHPELRGFAMDSSAEVQYYDRLLQTAQAIPGVESAARVNTRPFSTNMELLYVDGIDSVQKLGRFVIQLATPEYFQVMGTRILRGRPFTAADGDRAPRVTVVSESMAGALWPGKAAIGRCIRISADSMPCTTVIGIAEDAAYNNLTDEKRFTHYLPLAQFRPGSGNILLLRMAAKDPSASADRVRRELQRVMPGQGYVTVRPLQEFVDAQRRSWALGATMFVAFGVLALLVAAVGIYGVISYNVAQRMHELGVRIALGAQGRDVVRLVVGQGLRFAVAGVVLGLALALLAAKWIQPLLFQQSARDPATYAVVAGLLLAIALLASAVPARRATRADPNSALRSD
jgi:putative ABC transport system permease protein